MVLLLVAALVVGVDGLGVSAAAAEDARPDRLFGATRYETAAAIAGWAFPAGAPTVYVARGDDAIDALSAGSLRDGPILLVPPGDGGVPAVVATLVAELDPDRVVAVGGTAAVSDATLAMVAAGRPTARLSGADRYATGAAIARYVYPDGAHRVYVARSDDPVDAVAGGALTDGPVLPVPRTGTLPGAISAVIAELDPAEVVALGGSAAIADDVLAAAAAGRPSSRLAGPDRYATAAAIATHAYPRGANNVYAARGDVYADAVAGGVLTDGPILLVPSCGALPPAVASALDSLGPYAATGLGGTGAVCDSLLDAARGRLEPPPAPDDEVVSASTLRMATAEADATVLAVDDATGTVTLSARAPPVNVGEVLWLEPTQAAPWGGAYLVTGSSTDGSGNTVLSTEPAPIGALHDQYATSTELDLTSTPLYGVPAGARWIDAEGKDLGPVDAPATPYDAIVSGRTSSAVETVEGAVAIQWPASLTAKDQSGSELTFDLVLTLAVSATLDYEDGAGFAVDYLQLTVEQGQLDQVTLPGGGTVACPCPVVQLSVGVAQEWNLLPGDPKEFPLGMIPLGPSGFFMQPYVELSLSGRVEVDLTGSLYVRSVLQATLDLDAEDRFVAPAPERKAGCSTATATPCFDIRGEHIVEGSVSLAARASVGIRLLFGADEAANLSVFARADASFALVGSMQQDGSTEPPGLLPVGTIGVDVEAKVGAEAEALGWDFELAAVEFPDLWSVILWRTAPPAPSVTLTHLSAPERVELSWPAVAGATVYAVHRSAVPDDCGRSFVDTFVAVTSGTAFVDDLSGVVAGSPAWCVDAFADTLEGAATISSEPSYAHTATIRGGSAYGPPVLVPVAPDFPRSLAISGDGQHVAFEGDVVGEARQVHLQDLVAGTTTLVSAALDGSPGNGQSFEPALSSDGRYVAFSSWASDLVPGDDNGTADVFLRDLVTGTTTLVSAALDGTPGNGSSKSSPDISADGRYVAFSSHASDLVSADDNAAGDAFVRDLQDGSTMLVSMALDGTPGAGDSSLAALSSNGSHVAFASGAADLVATDGNSGYDVFLRDLAAGTTVLVSATPAGSPGNGPSGLYPLSVSADASFVAFASSASDLVANDDNADTDVFVRNLAAGETLLVSVALDGSSGDGRSGEFEMSADGRYVVFTSWAPDLVVGDSTTGHPDDQLDVFVRDGLSPASTTLVSVAADGSPGAGFYWSPTLSADGARLAFASSASDLVIDDDNAAVDIFLVSSP